MRGSGCVILGVKTGISQPQLYYFLATLNRSIIIKIIENTNPKTATRDNSPILGPDSETKTIAVATILAPRIIARIRLITLDFIN